MGGDTIDREFEEAEEDTGVIEQEKTILMQSICLLVHIPNKKEMNGIR
jgi:hypothetical protein